MRDKTEAEMYHEGYVKSMKNSRGGVFMRSNDSGGYCIKHDDERKFGALILKNIQLLWLLDAGSLPASPSDRR